MNVLLLEDEDHIALTLVGAIGDAATAASVRVDIVHVRNRDEAIDAIRDEARLIDMAILDLQVPPDDVSAVADVKHGLEVLDEASSSSRGTKILVFTAHGRGRVMSDLMDRTWADDPFGSGESENMLEFVDKGRLRDCAARVVKCALSQTPLAEPEISSGSENLALPAAHERVLRIYARKRAARRVKVSGLEGGLSQSTTLRLELFRKAASPFASLVAKIGRLPELEREQRGYDQHVAPSLAIGSFPQSASEVRAGAGGYGANFYRLAEAYDSNLSKLLDADQEAATAAVGVLRTFCTKWHEARSPERVTVADVRRVFVDDPTAAAFPRVAGLAISDAERIEVDVHITSQHSDMHVFNVLISQDQQPLLIDFARAQDAPAAVDPVTLELSPVFHPLRGGSSWPTLDQARNWRDLGTYLRDCPYPSYVEACRKWANDAAAGDREVAAIVYGYALWQITHDNRTEFAEQFLLAALEQLAT